MPPVPTACIDRIVSAVAVDDGKIRCSSLATLMMKNFLNGVTKKIPKKEHTKVSVMILPKSSLGFSVSYQRDPSLP